MSIAIIGVIILSIAVVGGWFLVQRRETEEKQIKMVFFVFYFWLLAFIQLVLFALVYYLMTEFGLNLFK